MSVTLSDLEIVDAHETPIDVSAFDCADNDLNEFLKTDCHKYAAQRLSYTKIALLNGDIVGFVALLADSISLEITERGWLLSKNINVQHIPALKVGRLGIHKDFKGRDIGTALIRYSIGIAFRINSNLNVGCRFLTVDAYPASVGFYEKLGFVKSLHKKYRKHEHPSMHYDLVDGKSIG
jgi:GNAT superfamily N-acetyltransferase